MLVLVVMALKSRPAWSIWGAGNWPHLWHLPTTRICRQDGHDEWDTSHVSMHETWKAWPHCGKTLSSFPSMNSPKHMAQSATDSFGFLAPSESYVNLGRDWSTFFFRPLFARAWARAGDRVWVELRRSQAHRATAMSPTTHMSAQRRAASMTTKSDSTVRASGGGAAAAVVDEFAGARVVRERVMVGVREERKRWLAWGWGVLWDVWGLVQP